MKLEELTDAEKEVLTANNGYVDEDYIYYTNKLEELRAEIRRFEF